MSNDPERALALTYAPAGARRDALSALLTLDETLGDVVRTTTQPAIGQIRLAWWRDSLRRLDTAPPPAMPVLEAVAATLLPLGTTGAALAEMVDGWDVLIEEEVLDDAALTRFAGLRGGRLFAVGARVLGGDARHGAALGSGWALVDFARYSEDAAVGARAMALGRERLRGSLGGVAKPLGMLALAARLDADGAPHGGPKRAARLAWFGLSGR
ncbi:squalene/phytoene synthase family protein [Sphingomonas silueang]|uniref:squalene/phytoene synthase family protein n=1 Tax=Sphingomonas silueang TaxID=3156617 RepID=UPI0032B3FE1A